MQVNNNGYTHANEKAIQNANIHQTHPSKQKEDKELTVEEQINKSAVEVSLSMNAQIILLAMDAQDLTRDNTKAQNAVLNFLSGKEVEGELSLKDIGYDGKPITELSKEEAEELISDEGFFGVIQTSQRVADFVLGFAGDNLENLAEARKGIVQGFEEAEKMWGGKLPQISYDTQARTLELIDTKINGLQNTEASKEIE